jgi:hypothetical protein
VTIHTINKLQFLIPVCLGALLFTIFFGFEPLNPINVSWIFYFDLNTYDPLTHYLGAEYFRHSGWYWPPGFNPSYGLEIASSIVFSDSIPLFAFLLKTFDHLLPRPFQYLGIWTFFCIFFQINFSYLIINLYQKNIFLCILGASLIGFAPPLLFRMGLHTALCSQFLICIDYIIDRNYEINGL